MDRYTVSGLSVATAATADLVIAELWNPSSTKSLFVRELGVFKTTAGAADRPKLRRSTARGTAGSTVTPGAANHHAGGVTAPATGAVLDINVFTGVPTLATGDLHQAVLSAGVGGGLIWNFGDEALEVPAGKGLCLCTGSALAFPVSTVYFGWAE
jgi:hypothetical protein